MRQDGSPPPPAEIGDCDQSLSLNCSSTHCLQRSTPYYSAISSLSNSLPSILCTWIIDPSWSSL